MDIHRARFVPYPPSAITALAFSHASSHGPKSTSPSTLRLAVGRANGDIEIWNPLKGAWHHEITCRGGKDRSVDGLAWTQDPDDVDEDGKIVPGRLRLFSIGYSSAVTEWDLSTGLPARQGGGSHSEFWCLAAQPPSQPANEGYKSNGDERSDLGERRGQNLVAGCADGTTVILSTAHSDLTFQKFLARPSDKRARALSITFQNRDTVVVGYANGTMRVYDMRNGSVLRHITFGGGPKGGPKETLVWAVKCLPDGTIVSGDSTGEVRFWDGKNYSQLQRIQGHETDVLCLAASHDGQMLFSGGMDRRTVVYRLTDRQGSKRKTWASVARRQYHTHDVKAMASFEGGKMSVVASGGVDTMPVVIPLREHGRENHRTISSLPQTPQVVSAPSARLLVSWWEREVDIWRINPRPRSTDAIETEMRSRKLVARMAIKGEENITSLAMTEDGRALAVATSAETKVFGLKSHKAERGERARVRKIDTPRQLSKNGARLVQFSPDGKWLLSVSHANRTYVARLQSKDNTTTPSFANRLFELRRSTRHGDEGGKRDGLNGIWGRYDATVVRAAFSADSRILLICDLAGRVSSWILHGDEDLSKPDHEAKREKEDASAPDSSGDSSDDSSDEHDDAQPSVFGQSWIVNPSAHQFPKLPAAPLIVSFRPSTSPQIPHNRADNSTDSNHALAKESKAPRIEDRLLIVTATHHILEFHALTGRLTDWARRNPISAFPEEFRSLRDRAMGCIWDSRPQMRGQEVRQRVWLYGSAWLFMLDLGQDIARRHAPESRDQARNEETRDVSVGKLGNYELTGIEDVHDAKTAKPADASNRGKKKRKREEIKMQERKKSTKGTSGAGSKTRSVKDGQIRKLNTKEARGDAMGQTINQSRMSQRGYDDDAGDDDEEDEDEEKMIVTTQRGRNEGVEGREDEEASEGLDKDGNALVSHNDEAGRKWWITHKYRPILGIVPLEGTEVEGEQQQGVEVVLVERPEWDMDLPPRFFGQKDHRG